LARAQSLAAALPDAAFSLRLAWTSAAIARQFAEPRKAERISREALESCDDGAPAEISSGLWTERALCLRALGRLDEAREAAENAVDIAARAGGGRASGLALEALATSHAALGQWERARAAYELAREEAERTSDRRLEAQIVGGLAELELRGGQREAALEAFQRAAALLGELGSRPEELRARIAICVLHLERGERSLAREQVEWVNVHAPVVGDPAVEALCQALLGVVEALEDRQGFAELAFDRAERLAATSFGEGVVEAVSIHRGHLDLQLARSAELAGDRERASAAVARATRRLERFRRSDDKPHWSHHVAAAERLLERELAGLVDEPWVVQVEGKWFAPPGGERVAVEHRPTLARFIAQLLSAHRERPGQPLTIAQLAETVWPGEKMLQVAAKNRVHVAVSSLRKLGLAALLLHRDRGYLLDPSARIRWHE
jgi:tetratricopeptide (TPR) repeat protein